MATLNNHIEDYLNLFCGVENFFSFRFPLSCSKVIQQVLEWTHRFKRREKPLVLHKTASKSRKKLVAGMQKKMTHFVTSLVVLCGPNREKFNNFFKNFWQDFRLLKQEN